jgi:hypothetical protein
MAIDLNRIAAAAAESYLQDRRQPAREEDAQGKDRHLGGLGAVALGVGLAVAARAAYSRIRRFDLERAAGTVEDKLSR